MESMELFGKAVYDYYKGEQKTAFYLVDMEGNEFEQDLSWYFRKNLDEFDSIEKTLFDNISGDYILDIGCATGYYFPIFKDRVKYFKAIDISKDLIKICEETGYDNVYVSDIMNDKISGKFDTITLVGNNLSIGGNIEGTKKLIGILKGLLNYNGKILCIFKKEEKDYFIGEFKSKYNGVLSDSFKWIRINIIYLEKLLKEQQLKLKILSENDYGYCLEIIKDR